MFGGKDVFTSLNVLSGVVAIYFCIKQQPLWASYAVVAGYGADVLDGLWARLTRTGNRFGSEYDTAADFVAQAIAPAFVIYLVYAGAWRTLGISPRAAEALGFALAAVLVVTACIRQARNTVRPVAVDFVWIGLPRVVASFVLLGFANSVFWARLPGGLWIGVLLVLGVAAAELTSLPFMSHHGRKQLWYAKILMIGFLTTTPIAMLFFREYAWDVLFFWTFGYTVASWTAMTPEERVQIRQAVVAANQKLVADEIARARGRRA
jgi:phosphatidylserine synthase